MVFYYPKSSNRRVPRMRLPGMIESESTKVSASLEEYLAGILQTLQRRYFWTIASMMMEME